MSSVDPLLGNVFFWLSVLIFLGVAGLNLALWLADRARERIVEDARAWRAGPER